MITNQDIKFMNNYIQKHMDAMKLASDEELTICQIFMQTLIFIREKEDKEIAEIRRARKQLNEELEQ